MRWSTFAKKLFDALEPQAVFVAQTARPLSVTVHTLDGNGIERRFGGNRPTRPVKIGTTMVLKDTITSLINHNPFVVTKVERRIWLPRATKADARRLAGEACYVLTQAAERAGYGELLHGFVDGGPQFTAAKFEHVVIELAHALNIGPAWTETELAAFIDRAGFLGRLRGIDAGNRRAWAALMDKMMAHEARRAATPGTESQS